MNLQERQNSKILTDFTEKLSPQSTEMDLIKKQSRLIQKLQEELEISQNIIKRLKNDKEKVDKNFEKINEIERENKNIKKKYAKEFIRQEKKYQKILKIYRCLLFGFVLLLLLLIFFIIIF